MNEEEFVEKIKKEMVEPTEEYERHKAEYFATLPLKRGRKFGSGKPKEYKRHSIAIRNILQAEKMVYSYDDVRLAYKMGKEDCEAEYKEILQSLEHRIEQLEAEKNRIRRSNDQR